MTTDYPDWMGTGQLVADGNSPLAKQIAAYLATGNPTGLPGGVPLLGAPENLSMTGTGVIAAGANQVAVPLNSANINNVGGFLSYYVHIRATCNSASTVPFLTYILTWYQDSAGSVPLYRERWTLAQNALSGGTSVFGVGPVRGAYLGVTCTNQDTVNSQTINGMQFTFSSRPSPSLQPDWRTVNPTSSIPGYTVPGHGNSDDGVLGLFAIASLAASTTDNCVFGLFNGQAQLTVTVTAGTSPNFTCFPAAFLDGTPVPEVIGEPLSFNAVGSATETLFLPRSNLILQCENLSASNAITFNAVCVAAANF